MLRGQGDTASVGKGIPPLIDWISWLDLRWVKKYYKDEKNLPSYSIPRRVLNFVQTLREKSRRNTTLTCFLGICFKCIGTIDRTSTLTPEHNSALRATMQRKCKGRSAADSTYYFITCDKTVYFTFPAFDVSRYRKLLSEGRSRSILRPTPTLSFPPYLHHLRVNCPVPRLILRIRALKNFICK